MKTNGLNIGKWWGASRRVEEKYTNDGYKSIQVGMYSNRVDTRDQMKFMLEHDVGLAAYAGIIMVFYLIFFLGGFSPIHCRMLVTIAGLICIYLSVFAGSLFG